MHQSSKSMLRETAVPDLGQGAGWPCRILIADDHAMFREGLRRLLEAEPGFEVIGEAEGAEEAICAARDLHPDIILLDLAMPGKDGLHALHELSADSGVPGIILLTASITSEEIVRAIQLGAHGIILKESTTRLLFDAIWQVMKGQYWIHPEKMSDLVQALKRFSNTTAVQSRQKEFGLTPRERDIVGMVVAGYSNPDIARKCSISEQTVKHHVSNIFDKLGVFNRVELALFAVNHGLI
jgi:two-component system, NarL family, nitrate/nitrite response regulator NarL